MTTRTWVKGTHHRADNPKLWSANGAPQPGDPLYMQGGTMNIGGFAVDLPTTPSITVLTSETVRGVSDTGYNVLGIGTRMGFAGGTGDLVTAYGANDRLTLNNTSDFVADIGRSSGLTITLNGITTDMTILDFGRDPTAKIIFHGSAHLTPDGRGGSVLSGFGGGGLGNAGNGVLHFIGATPFASQLISVH
jgi:hypothetical protein